VTTADHQEKLRASALTRMILEAVIATRAGRPATESTTLQSADENALLRGHIIKLTEKHQRTAENATVKSAHLIHAQTPGRHKAGRRTRSHVTTKEALIAIAAGKVHASEHVTTVEMKVISHETARAQRTEMAGANRNSAAILRGGKIQQTILKNTLPDWSSRSPPSSVHTRQRSLKRHLGLSKSYTRFRLTIHTNLHACTSQDKRLAHKTWRNVNKTMELSTRLRLLNREQTF